MKVYLATDHAGFELKEKVKQWLKKEGYAVEDCGAYEFDKTDDYQDFVSKAAAAVSNDPQNSRAIILGGSGQAEAILANKFRGVRAALFYAQAVPVGVADVTGRTSDDPFEMIRLTREHNNTNVLSLGARFLTVKDILKVVKLWLEESFPAHERHVRRLEKIRKIEDKYFI